MLKKFSFRSQSMVTPTAAHHLPEAASSVGVKMEAGVPAGELKNPGVRLPFDPLRMLDSVFRYRWHALAAGAVLAVVLGLFVGSRLTTRHTAGAQLLKLAPQNSLRQSEGGDPYTPHDVTIPNMVAIMWSGPVIEGAARRLEGKMDARTLRAGLAVKPERNTDIIHVSINSDVDRETALAALDAYLTEAIDFTRHLQQHDAESITGLLADRIARAEEEISAYDREMLEYSTREGVVDPDKQTDALLGEIANQNLRYQGIRLEHETLDLRIAEIEAELAKVSPTAAKLQVARDELAALRLRYTEEHPVMGNALAAVAALEVEVERESQQPRVAEPPRPGESPIAGSLYLDLVKLRGEKSALAEQLAKLEEIQAQLAAQAETLPRKSLELANIRARKTAAETSRDLLAARLREANLVEERADGAFRVLHQAGPDDVAVSTATSKAAIAAAGGLVAGAGLVALLAAILVLFDRRIGSAGDLKRVTSLPIVGQLHGAALADAKQGSDWAFTTWTSLVPKLRRKDSEQALVCGIVSAGPVRLTPLLAEAAARRGSAVLLLTVATGEEVLDLEEALEGERDLIDHLRRRPENVLQIHLSEKWLRESGTRTRLLEAIARWSKETGLAVLLELTEPSDPGTLLLCERLPNLLWVSRGKDEIAPLAETVRLYRTAGCSLSGALLEDAPGYQLKSLRHLEPLLGLGKVAAFILPLLLSLPVRAQQPLLLGPGDKVNIRFQGAPELSREGVTVAPDGTLTFLQVQSLPVSGFTIDNLRHILTHQLARYYHAPRITVTPNLFDNQRVYVLGKIVRKGAVALNRPMRVLDVVAEAGGLETGLFQQNTVELADLRRSFLSRGGQRVPMDFEALFMRGDTSHNQSVLAGDYLYFPSANSNEIHVFGNVKSQGSQGLLAHTTVHSAIAQAGGFTEKAFRRRVLVVRGSLENPQTYVVDMDRLLAGKDPAFALEPKDIVYIADRPWARAEELLGIALNTFCQGAVSAWASVNTGSFDQN